VLCGGVINLLKYSLFKQIAVSGLLWFRLFFAIFAAICQGAVFAMVFLTSLAIAVARTGVAALAGFIYLFWHSNSFCNIR